MLRWYTYMQSRMENPTEVWLNLSVNNTNEGSLNAAREHDLLLRLIFYPLTQWMKNDLAEENKPWIRWNLLII